MTVTNKRLLISESHGDSNRCTPYRRNPDQHDTCASHTSSRTPGIRFLWVVPVRDNLSWGTDKFGQISLLLTQSTARQLTDRASVPSFSPEPANEARGISQAPVDDQLLGLPGSYYRYVIGTFNTCSCGLTHRSLTDTGGGYNLGGADLPYTHSPAFPTSRLPFSSKGPARSPV
jgi:hypothetical protein